MRRKISHESHYFHLGLKEYIIQMHLSTSKWWNSPWSLVRFEFFLLPQFKWRKNSTLSGKCMRAVCIPPRATSVWSRSHMPGICYIPAKTGRSKSVQQQHPADEQRGRASCTTMKHPSFKKVTPTLKTLTDSLNCYTECMNTFQKGLHNFNPWWTKYQCKIN